MADHDEDQDDMPSYPSGSSTSSSASSRRFRLDERSDQSILVYKVRSGYEISSQKELCRELDKDRRWRCSRKPISRGTSRLNIQTRDLFNEPERTTYSKYPNATSSVASVGIPRGVYWRRMLFGHFQNLYIVSPENSPSSSLAGSPEDGRSPADSGGNTAQSSPEGPTPSNTFNLGAEQ